MENKSHSKEREILAKVRAALAPLTCEPLWNLDHDRLGFFMHDARVRRGARFAPVKLAELEQDDRLKLKGGVAHA